MTIAEFNLLCLIGVVATLGAVALGIALAAVKLSGD